MKPMAPYETKRIFLCLLFFLENTSAGSVSFTVKNNCPYPIWPAAQDNANVPSLGNTGFALTNQGDSTIISVPAGWGGRFWARTGCATDGSGRIVCASADCGSGQIQCNGSGGARPATLAEFTLNGTDGRKVDDIYIVSNVGGFNVPVSIAPGSGCAASSCSKNINTDCPAELQAKDSSGDVIGCKSACLAFGDDSYCCTGANNTPETCPPTNYSEFFSSECPQALSYAYDDFKGTFTCPSGGDYTITFCPLITISAAGPGWVDHVSATPGCTTDGSGRVVCASGCGQSQTPCSGHGLPFRLIYILITFIWSASSG